jgi:hypothetical protein
MPGTIGPIPTERMTRVRACEKTIPTPAREPMSQVIEELHNELFGWRPERIGVEHERLAAVSFTYQPIRILKSS